MGGMSSRTFTIKNWVVYDIVLPTLVSQCPQSSHSDLTMAKGVGPPKQNRAVKKPLWHSKPNWPAAFPHNNPSIPEPHSSIPTWIWIQPPPIHCHLDLAFSSRSTSKDNPAVAAALVTLLYLMLRWVRDFRARFCSMQSLKIASTFQWQEHLALASRSPEPRKGQCKR